MAKRERDSYWNGINIIGGPGWGDEGKGRYVDFASQSIDMNIRYNGGGNAGHTVVNDLGEFKFHILPSTSVNPEVVSVIAGTVIVDPIQAATEIRNLQARGIDVKLLMDSNAHMAMPWHKALDGLKEALRGNGKIGTTGQGIGPTIAQRASRSGLRTGDLLSPNFETMFHQELAEQQSTRRQIAFELLLRDFNIESLTAEQLQSLFQEANQQYYDPKQILKDLYEARETLAPYIANVLPTIWSYEQDKDKNILGESAQGALLDLDLGGYPYVTSSNPGVAGFIKATAIDRRRINRVIGVTKAYTTRVGEGPMPTEQNDDIGHYLQEVGQEIGTTTGRSRRCGWLDIPAMRYGAKVLGADAIVISKLDVLDQLPYLKICTAYEIDGQMYNTLPNPNALQRAIPHYEIVEGWQRDTSQTETYEALPQNARHYVARVEKLMDKRVDMVSVGQHRNATLSR